MKQGLKDYSEILSDDEFAQVCRMGNPDELRKIYVRHPRAFTDLMPGFRANTLTDEQAYSVITKHRKDPFAEDLKLEPPSLINYCLPVLTEKLVDTYPRTEYITG